MLDSGYLGQLIAGIFYLVVGVALLRLSRRTGMRPERFLGMYFLFSGVDYVSYSAAFVFQLDSIYAECSFLARAAYAVAVVHLVIFIRDVFRPTERWATALAAICSLGLIASLFATALQGAWEGVEIDSFWYWPDFLGYTSALIWLTFEAFRAHSGARRRLRIGLCDRTIVNRYLLWACFGVFQVLACAGVIVVGLDARGGQAVSGLSDSLLSGAELASIATAWLAFFPPAAYLSWIAGSQADSDSAAEAER
jgi:hypothetical protein